MKTLMLIGTAVFMLPAALFPDDGTLPNRKEVKNIIVMVADGMGLADVTATRIRKNGISGFPLHFETLDNIGYQRTYSEKNTVTDSSAAASAWACGEKFVNNEVCFHADGRPNNQSILELAKARGWATGLVATQTITHATPAAFASHTPKRTCETEIARQYILDTQPDVLLGGGVAIFQSQTPDACGASGDYIYGALQQGYTFAGSRNAMEEAVDEGTRKLLGLFAPKNLTPVYKRLPGTTEPELPDMASAALRVLERNQFGFFLMIEGSLIDSGNHEENMEYQYGELSAFDDAVKVVLDWINASAERQQHTLLIVLVDHETGGFAIKGTEKPGGETLGFFVPGWTFVIIPTDPLDKEAHHTGGDVMIWSQGPGSEALGKAIDNTLVYHIMRATLW